MASRPSEGIGKRLAKYRRLSGLSARELADQAGMGLTRGVVANIESGRKSDITVDQLIALSTVLRIPPVALALPVESPYSWLLLTTGTPMHVRGQTAQAVEMFLADRYRDEAGEGGPESHAGYVASELVRATSELSRAESLVRVTRSRVSAGEVAEDVLREQSAKLAQIRDTLARLGADLTDHRIDE